MSSALPHGAQMNEATYPPRGTGALELARAALGEKNECHGHDPHPYPPSSRAAARGPEAHATTSHHTPSPFPARLLNLQGLTAPPSRRTDASLRTPQQRSTRAPMCPAAAADGTSFRLSATTPEDTRTSRLVGRRKRRRDTSRLGHLQPRRDGVPEGRSECTVSRCTPWELQARRACGRGRGWTILRTLLPAPTARILLDQDHTMTHHTRFSHPSQESSPSMRRTPRFPGVAGCTHPFVHLRTGRAKHAQDHKRV